MEKYLNQLIGDLREARKRAPVHKPQNDMSGEEIWDELEEIDRIIDEEPDVPMHNIFGIDPIMFPPVEKLTNEQAKRLAGEILELWGYFNIDAVYPDNFPLYKLYPLLVDKFKKPFLYFPMGMTGIEFCNYEPSECPFGDEYCTCKDFEFYDDGLDNKKGGEDLPY